MSRAVLNKWEMWQNRSRPIGDGEDYPLSDGEDRLRHLLPITSVIVLLADVLIHFCQDGHEVKTPVGKIKRVKVLLTFRALTTS